MTDYAIFGHDVKTTERSRPDNFTLMDHYIVKRLYKKRH